MNKNRKLTLAACCGVHAVQDGLGATLYVLLPILAQAFGFSYSQVGIIRAANNSAMMLFEIPSGVIAERLGERSLLVFGLVCAGIGFLFLSNSTSFVAILFSLLLVGFGAAFQHSLSSSVISKTFRAGGRRTALGVYNSSGDVGKLAFTGLFSLVIGMAVAWQNIVTGFGVIALFGAVAMLVVLRHLGVGDLPQYDAPARQKTRNIGWGIRDRAGFTALAIIVSLDIAVQGAFLTFLAFLMIEKQVPTGLAAFAVVLTLAGGIFGKLGCGFLAERLGVIRSLVVVQCLTAIAIVAVSLSPTLIAYCMLPVLGVVLQGSSSITYGTVSDLVHGDRQSRGFAAIYSISSAAAIIGPICFGVIGDYVGLSIAMFAMALIVVLPLPLTVLLRPALAGKVV